MNISTYEARIAALEAQLGPGPEPVQETGIVSVVVTPDITLSDGTSLNAKLAEMMPIESGQENINTQSVGALETQYQVTIKPGTTWHARKSDNTFGGQGEQVTNTVNPQYGIFGSQAIAVEDPEDESTPDAVIIFNIRETV